MTIPSPELHFHNLPSKASHTLETLILRNNTAEAFIFRTMVRSQERRRGLPDYTLYISLTLASTVVFYNLHKMIARSTKPLTIQESHGFIQLPTATEIKRPLVLHPQHTRSPHQHPEADSPLQHTFAQASCLYRKTIPRYYLSPRPPHKIRIKTSSLPHKLRSWPGSREAYSPDIY